MTYDSFGEPTLAIDLYPLSGIFHLTTKAGVDGPDVRGYHCVSFARPGWRSRKQFPDPFFKVQTIVRELNGLLRRSLRGGALSRAFLGAVSTIGFELKRHRIESPE